MGQKIKNKVNNYKYDILNRQEYISHFIKLINIPSIYIYPIALTLSYKYLKNLCDIM